MAHPKFLAYLVVFRFERWCSKPNTISRSKSEYLTPPKGFSWIRHWDEETCVKLPPRVHVRHTFGDLKIFDTITACISNGFDAVVHNRGARLSGGRQEISRAA